MKQQQQKDGGSLCDRGTPRSTIGAFSVGDDGAEVGRDPRYDAQLPEKNKPFVRNRASNANARRLPLGDRRVTPSVQCGHFSCTDTVRIRFDHQPVMVDFLHSLTKNTANDSSVESKKRLLDQATPTFNQRH